VGGASMGAIIAAAYALDLPVERLTELAVKFSDPKKLLDYTFPYASITSTRRITALLQEFCSGANIEDTWRPYFCVSANLTRGEEQVHSSGMLWKSVRASMAFPAVFAPVLEDGCVLIDGGAANNLPVDRMREMCPTGTVIGVDLLTSSPTSGSYDFGPSLSGWQALLGRLSPFAHPVKAPNLLDIIAGVVYSNNRYRLNEVWRCADLLIRVPVESYGLLEFDKYAQIIDLGYVTAKESIKDFKPG
jgi:predicted acylesterase/phospholipase RssA